MFSSCEQEKSGARACKTMVVKLPPATEIHTWVCRLSSRFIHVRRQSKITSKQTAMLQSDSMPRRVSLFVTCIVDQLFPKVGMAMADVLERIGYEVDFPEAQTCCGQPAFNSGFRAEARQVAAHFLKVFRDAEYIVVPSGSCTSMIAHHFAELFTKDAAMRAAAHALEPRVWEFSRFLLDVARVDDVG